MSLSLQPATLTLSGLVVLALEIPVPIATLRVPEVVAQNQKRLPSNPALQVERHLVERRSAAFLLPDRKLSTK